MNVCVVRLFVLHLCRAPAWSGDGVPGTLLSKEICKKTAFNPVALNFGLKATLLYIEQKSGEKPQSIQ